MEIQESNKKFDTSVLDEKRYKYTTIGDYKVLRTLGQGGTSKIKLAYNTKTG